MVDIGGLINRLAPLIEKTVTQEYNLFINFKTEAQKLPSNLKEIQKVLEEAEKRRLTDPRVKNWLGRLQSVMYEIDDALDEWETENFQIQNQEFCDCDGDDDGEAGLFCTWLNKVSIFIQSLCSGFKHVCKHRDVALNIKGLNEKVELLANETPKYSILLPINSDSPAIKPKITTSFSQLVEVQGQLDQKVKIINELGTSHDLEGNIQVISLVGMAGIGKTTLAQLSFHDRTVREKFELRLWICLSHTSDEVCVTKAILQSLDVSYPEDADLQKLLKLLHSFVSGKKLLLVLDNVWIEDDSFWRQLKGSLIYGNALKSRVLVTSRNENVAKSMGSTRIIRVECLSHSDCWLLFKEIAFCGMGDDESENLQGIGQRIAEKCKGLPLAAKTLGCYLRSRYNKKLWEDILDKELWQLEEVAEALFAPFALSYIELPLALKQCVSYCGILPRDKVCVIDVDELIRLWMVQGYLISADGTDDDMELKGMYYFEKLATRSFFQNVRKHDSKRYYKKCKMHSIVHDFAQYLIKTAGNKVEEQRNTFIEDDQPFGNQLGSLKSVRVLSVRAGAKQELPWKIRNLIHLRYLHLKQHTIKKLPVSVCDLYNLHTLDLRLCEELSELPKRIHRLRNLRHLLLQGTNSLEQVPEGVGKLTHLRTLDEYKVGRESSDKVGSKLRYLADLNQLRGSMTIHIRELNEETDVEDAKKAQLGNKNYITDLILSFYSENVRMDVMEALQPPPNLQYLWLTDYRRTEFPIWVNGTNLKRLIYLRIDKSPNCLHLPPLGTLPFLEDLEIVSLESLKRVGREFLGEGNDPSPLFPKLRKLQFLGCKKWKEWEDITENEGSSNTLSIMPCLKKLTIKNCHRLKTLPHFLLSSINVDTDREDLQLLWGKRPKKKKTMTLLLPQLVHQYM